MAAATRIVTPQDYLNRTKEGRRGRPTILSKQGIMAVILRKDNWRHAVNCAYVEYGKVIVAAYLGDEQKDKLFEIFQPDGHRIRYQGVLEQIGRAGYEATEKDDSPLTEDDVLDMVEMALEEIKNGAKSKEIEQLMRYLRLCVKNGTEEDLED